MRAETEKDLAEARSLIAAGDRSGLRPQIARAEAALTSADAALAGDGAPDPLAALRQLEEADIALEQALSVARDAQTQDRRAAAALDQALMTARSTIDAADDFINTRRGRGRPGGADPAGRGAAAPRRRRGTGPGRPGPRAAGGAPGRVAGAEALERAQDDVSGWSGGGYGGGSAAASAAGTAAATAAAGRRRPGQPRARRHPARRRPAAATAVVAAGSAAASAAAVAAAASVAAASAAAVRRSDRGGGRFCLPDGMQFHWFLPTRGDGERRPGDDGRGSDPGAGVPDPRLPLAARPAVLGRLGFTPT